MEKLDLKENVKVALASLRKLVETFSLEDAKNAEHYRISFGRTLSERILKVMDAAAGTDVYDISMEIYKWYLLTFEPNKAELTNLTASILIPL